MVTALVIRSFLHHRPACCDPSDPLRCITPSENERFKKRKNNNNKKKKNKKQTAPSVSQSDLVVRHSAGMQMNLGSNLLKLTFLS